MYINPRNTVYSISLKSKKPKDDKAGSGVRIWFRHGGKIIGSAFSNAL